MEKDVKRVKYPKTPHLPFSPGLQNDDRLIESLDFLIDQEVVVSEKLDGQNTTIYPDNVSHARSIDGRYHSSQSMMKSLTNNIHFNIPYGHRLCGENVYAKHSIFYDQLTAFFYLFSIWNEKEECLSWDETVEWAQILGVQTVPVLYRGIWDEEKIKACWTGKSLFGPEQEGYVIRLASSFSLDEFSKSVSKMVRKGHVQTSQHWMTETVVPNLLKS